MNFDLNAFIAQVGYFGVWLIIFAESGLLIGFFLPGDSLIFTAGFLVSQGILGNIWVLVIGGIIAAVIGDNIGYEFGKRMGHRIFKREDSFLFHKNNLIKAQQFYEKHGGKAIVLARFIPVVRTFAPIVAGVGHMDHKRFTFFNLFGGVGWVSLLGFGGYFLGNLIPNVDRYILPVVLIIIVVSTLPPALHLYKENKTLINSKVRGFLKK